jgi:hypothetical protein
MIGARHANISAKTPGGGFDSLIIGGNPHFSRPTSHGKSVHVLDHWLARD